MLGFLIAVGAGFLVPVIEGAVGETIAESLRKHMELEMSETRVISLLIALILASLLALALHSGNAFSIALGLTIGYFGLRIIGIIKKAIDGK
ncbi:hypothetical protein SAMN04488515_1392 [Cognatiyoonia koreensis]|uniref:Uncharacterized protein n=1 Tax=Cognatiyoonia koreensis TaxID=364200 RepID=A0A1I0PS44_9RHOB|nr:hypothetical protein [Cognatiyoonia koreensis]SEW17231.1 hypothetical protein SAMN04488515_1392 [Cognatiyoonia koreensis]